MCVRVFYSTFGQGRWRSIWPKVRASGVSLSHIRPLRIWVRAIGITLHDTNAFIRIFGIKVFNTSLSFCRSYSPSIRNPLRSYTCPRQWIRTVRCKSRWSVWGNATWYVSIWYIRGPFELPHYFRNSASLSCDSNSASSGNSNQNATGNASLPTQCT